MSLANFRKNVALLVTLAFTTAQPPVQGSGRWP
jgi:hypothetical protein